MTQIIERKSLYDSDYLMWTEETIAKLKARDFELLDFENLIEEIESLGKSEKREVRNRLKILLEQLIKRIYVDMPDCFKGWENTIREQRSQIKLELLDSPSLKRLWDQFFAVVWVIALEKVRSEYKSQGFSFPDTWQYQTDLDSILNIDFWE